MRNKLQNLLNAIKNNEVIAESLVFLGAITVIIIIVPYFSH